MRKPDPVLTRTLRRRLREELRASETMWKAYMPFRRNQRLRAWGMGLLVVLGIPYLVVAGIALPLSFNIVFIGVAEFFIDSPAHVRGGNGSELALVLQAVFLTSLGLLFAYSLWKEIWISRKVGALAQLPLSDDEHFRKQVKDVGTSALLVPYFTLYGYVWLGCSLNFSPAAWVATWFLALFQGILICAVSLILLGRVPIFVQGVAAIILFLISGIGGMGGFLIRPWVEGYGWLAFAPFPAGWVNAAFYYGLVKGNWLGWLWLIPAAILPVLAGRRQPRGFALKGFILRLPRGEVEALPEKEYAYLKGSKFWTQWAGTEIAPGVQPLSLTDVQSLPRREFLTGFDWRLDWVLRLVGHWLTTREQTNVEALLVRPPRWGLWWKWALLVTLVCTAVLAIPTPRDIAVLLPVPGLVFFAALVFTGPSMPHGPSDRPPLARPWPWLPLGYLETARTLFKLHVLVCILLLPLVVGFGTLAGWRVEGKPLEGAFLALKCVYLVLTVYPWFVALLFGVSHNPTTIRGRVLELTVVIVLLLLTGLAGWMLFLPVQWAAASGALLLPASSGGLLGSLVNSLHRNRVDWIRR